MENECERKRNEASLKKTRLTGWNGLGLILTPDEVANS